MERKILSAQASAATKTRLITALKWILILALFGLLGWNLTANWSEVSEYPWRIRPALAGASIALVLVAYFLSGALWGRIIGNLGHTIGAISAFRITFLANLGRYLPGKIWQAVGVIALAKPYGVREQDAASSFVISQAFALPSSALVIALAVILKPGIVVSAENDWIMPALVLVAVISLLILLALIFAPAAMFNLANKGLVKIGREPVALSLKKKDAGLLFLGYSLYWVLHGLAFHVFLISIAPDNAPSAIESIGAFTLAHQIGYLALFAPGGVGVREVFLAGALAPFYNETAGALAILARVWAMIAEALAALIALRLK